MKNFLTFIFISLFYCNYGLTNELIKIPVIVHIVDIDEKIKINNYELDENGNIKTFKKLVEYKTIANKKIIEDDFKKVNKIWKQASIYFNVIKIDHTKSNTKNFKKNSKLLLNYNYDNSKNLDNAAIYHVEILDYKKNNNDNGINIYYIPWFIHEYCGLWDQENSIIIIGTNEEKKYDPVVKLYWSCSRYETLAHEFGHALQIDHVEVPGNLMIPDNLILESGTNLIDKQIKQSREFIKKVLGM